MKLLLDTHIWLWGLLGPARLTRRVAAELEDPSNELWLSPMSIWEFFVLVEKGRLTLNTDPAAWVRSVISKHPFKEAPLNYEVAIQEPSADSSSSGPCRQVSAGYRSGFRSDLGYC